MKSLKTGRRSALEAHVSPGGRTTTLAMPSDAASLAMEEPALVEQPNTALLRLALGMALTGMAVWASILAFQVSPFGDGPHRAGGMAALALAFAGLLLGCWAWRRWQQEIVAQHAVGAQLNNLHSVMSLTNRLMLRRPDPRELFEGVCEICLEAGLADFAVVEVAGIDVAHRAAIDTRAGILPRTLPELLLDGGRMRQVMTMLVRHAGKTVLVADASTDARLSEARNWCLGTGLCSLTAIPLRRGGVFAGILMLGSRSKSFFRPQLTPLLSELGADLSFALDNSDRERERQAAVLADRARASAEDANRAKTEFLAQMSHELRTPLNAILGFAQLLSTDRDQVLSQDQAERVRLITHAGWHLLGLVNDVMDISLIESRRFDVVIVGGDVSSVLDEAVALTQPLARTYKVALAEPPTSKFGVGVLADPRRLLQVLLNLLSNACKYNRPGGRVRVEVTHAGNEVFLDVLDNGVGMTKTQLAHLYEPFNRLGKAGCAVEGSGIGLTLARQLSGLMNGRLEIDSTPESGTRARLVLPAFAIPLRAFAREFEVPRALPRTQGEAVVLYIEDDMVNQILVEQMLLRCDGVTLVVAENGKEGLALARKRRPDLVLLDMQLPDMSGFDVLAALRADPRTEELRVVVVSANATTADVAKAKEFDVLAYWEKPLKLEPFLDGVAEILGLSDSCAPAGGPPNPYPLAATGVRATPTATLRN